MRFCVLGSGSKGNCTYVASEKTAILIDAGFSGVEVERRLAKIGVHMSQISAILVTHEHGDHVSGVSVLSRRHGTLVYANEQTKDASGKFLQNLALFCSFATGRSFQIADLTVHPFSVSHDTADPVGFTISDGNVKVGYCTDTGMVSKLIRHHLSSCHGLILECNHDLEMLKNGRYPLHVQQRVRSQRGHLANPQAMSFLKELHHDGLQQVVLAHISESNNSVDIIHETVDEFIRELEQGPDAMSPLQISLAHQDQVGEICKLTRRVQEDCSTLHLPI